MKKLYLVGLALLSVLAFSAIAAGSAFAEEALWLVDGVEAKEAFNSETTGELILLHLAGGFLEPEAIVKCSGVFVGSIGPEGQDEITELLSLTLEEGLLPNMIPCTNVKNCPEPLVAADNMPWLTLLELMANGTILDLFYVTELPTVGPQPGYEILCMGLGIETLCEGETSAVVELMAGSTSLLGRFTAAELEAEGEEGACGTHEKVALQEGEGEIALVNGKELDVSSP